MKLPFCYNCMPNEKIKLIRNKFEVPEISEDIFHKTEDSHGKSAKLLLPPSKISKSKQRNTSAHLNKSNCCISQGAGIGGISPVPQAASPALKPIHHEKMSRNPRTVNLGGSTIERKSVKEVRNRSRSHRRTMMKSFRKLEMIRHDLEEQRAKDKICNVTSDQTDFVSMMAKRLSNKRDGSVHNQGNPQLHKSHNVFYLKELDKSKSGNIAKPSKVIPSKGNKFKIIKVKRKTELGMNSKSNSKHLTKLTKMRRKSISSSSESFSYKENSSEKANAKIKESRIPTLSTNQMTMSTQGFLNIPVINMENSKTPTNRNSHKAKDLCSNPLVKNHSSRNTSSIIGRRMGEHLSVVGPQNTKISADCSKSATVKKCPNPRKFSFLQVETNNQSSRIKNPPKSPLKPDLKPIKKPKKTCVVNDIFYSMLRVDDLISSQPASSETHKQMTAIKSYLGRYSDLFKKTQSELLQIEVREADDLSQLSQFFDRIRKELDSKEELLKAKYKSMVNSYETSLSMDFEFLENK